MGVHLLNLSHHHSCIYICSIRCCDTLLTPPDWQGVTSVLLIGGCASAVAGAIYWVQVATLELWVVACFCIVGATDGCAVGAGGAH